MTESISRPEPVDIGELCVRMRSLELRHVLDLGCVPTAILEHWPDAKSDRIVIIGERYRHILARHDELIGQERPIIETVLYPQVIHVNRSDPRMAILYRSHLNGSRMRISLWITDNPRFQNSIHSARYAHESELIRGVKHRREAWRKS